MFARPRRSLAAPLGQQRVYQFVRVWFRLGGSFSSTSFSLTAAAVGPGQAMNFAVNEGLNGNLDYGISTVSIVPTKSLGSTQLTVGDAGASMASTITGRRSQASSRSNRSGSTPPRSAREPSHSTQRRMDDSTLADTGHIVLPGRQRPVSFALPTTFASQSGNTYTFTAITPGFSYFAIAAGSQQDTAAVTTTPALHSSVTGATTPACYPRRPSSTGNPSADHRRAPVAIQPVTSKVAATAPAYGRVPRSSLSRREFAGIVLIAMGGLLVRRWWIRLANPALSGNTINLFFGKIHISTYGHGTAR